MCPHRILFFRIILTFPIFNLWDEIGKTGYIIWIDSYSVVSDDVPWPFSLKWWLFLHIFTGNVNFVEYETLIFWFFKHSLECWNGLKFWNDKLWNKLVKFVTPLFVAFMSTLPPLICLMPLLCAVQEFPSCINNIFPALKFIDMLERV